MAKCEGWCVPAIIYVVLSIIGIIMNLMSAGLPTAAVNVIIVIFWTAILYWLCSICRSGWAWFLLLLPFLFAIIVIGSTAIVDVTGMETKTEEGF